MHYKTCVAVKNCRVGHKTAVLIKSIRKETSQIDMTCYIRHKLPRQNDVLGAEINMNHNPQNKSVEEIIFLKIQRSS